jgi:hypothetical protein
MVLESIWAFFKKWDISFNPGASPSSVPAWLRITFLLHEFWNEETFAAIANDLGKFAKFLDLTTPNKMSTCAKICLEMDNPLRSYTRLPMGARGRLSKCSISILFHVMNMCISSTHSQKS